MSEILEVVMIVSFGASWPMNVMKSWKARTAKGKSVVFEVLVIVGYLIGLFGKLYAYRQTGTLAYSVWFYIADILMVSVDLALYCVNTRRDRAAQTA